MIRFIHTADIHFGMENYGRIDPVTGIHTRLLDFQKALNFCIDEALQHNIDFFLFSGDAYKTTNPSPTQQRLLLKCFLRLYEANIPVIIVVGNHDNPLSFGKANSLDIFGELPVEGFHVVAKPQTISLQTKHGPVNIVGIPWPNKNNISIHDKHIHKTAHELTTAISQGVNSIIKQMASELDPEVPAVLAGHLTVSNGIFSGSEKRAIYGTDPVLMPSQLAIPPFDYVALGHLHRYQNLNPKGYPAVVYSGSIERIDFGERKEDKGFCLVTIEKKGTTTHQFIKTPMRPFVQIEVHLDPKKDQTEQILNKLKQSDLDGVIIKILYHLPAGAPDTVDLNAIERACITCQFVVGIIPIRPVITRNNRSAMKVDMDLQTLLKMYCTTKPELHEKQNAIIAKALELRHELENPDANE